MDTDTQQLPPSLAGRPPQQWIAAPSPVYLTGEEALRLTTVANLAALAVTVAGRVLRPDNTIAPFQFTQTPNSNRTALATIVALPEGWLLGAVAKLTSGAASFGAVWASLELVRGQGSAALAVQSLANDFLSANSPLLWPGSANVDPLEGAGNLRSIAGTTPGAGVNLSETVPTAARWQLLAFRFRMVTSATVATRVATIEIDDGTTSYLDISPNQTQTAGQTCTYNISPGGATGTSNADNRFLVPIAAPFFLGAGHRIKSSVLNLDAGDQISQVQYLVREWFDV